MPAIRLDDVNLDAALEDRKAYKRRLARAQLRLLYIQRQMLRDRRRAVLLFEGWDAAGKGGAVRRLVGRLDPRGYAVHPIGAPAPDEKARHYLHRFWTRLPVPGSFSILDRSWYGRVLVERVEQLCEPRAWRRAYDEINAFERMLVDDGVPILKFFLHISKQEQLRRFREREKDPFKSWKLTEDDWRNRKRWQEYREATDEMLERTATSWAPWDVVPAEHKWYARVSVLETAVQRLAAFFELSADALPDGWKLSED